MDELAGEIAVRGEFWMRRQELQEKLKVTLTRKIAFDIATMAEK
jgi:hypothetical protein